MAAYVGNPRNATFQTLRATRNRAAIATLSFALSDERLHDDPGLRAQLVQALCDRNEDEARLALLTAWPLLSQEDRDFVRQNCRRITEYCTQLLDSGSITEKRLAMYAVSDLDLAKSMDVLLDLVLDPRHPLSSQASQCLLENCRKWGLRARQGKDVPSKRGVILERLYNKIVLYHEHHNEKVVDAWLCLAHWDDSAQRGLISEPNRDAYRIVMQRLQESTDPQAIQLLAGYLGRTTTPSRVLDILCEREDAELAIAIAEGCDNDSLLPIVRHLKQLPPMRCVDQVEKRMNGCVDPRKRDVQHRLWQIVAASSPDLAMVLRGALKLSLQGTPEARRAAGSVLRHCRIADLDTLVPELQDLQVHPDVDGSTGRLLMQVAEWLHSPSFTLKSAARYFFREFTLENLLERTQQWPAQMCRAMGSIVKLMEPEAPEMLSRKLQSPARRHRMAALQATEFLECAEEVSSDLLPMLTADLLEVRVRTIDLLSALGFESLEAMLPELMADASTDIQDAANRAARRLQRETTQQG